MTVLSVAVALVLQTAAPQLQAQTADNDTDNQGQASTAPAEEAVQLDAIAVTFRRSLNAAILDKRAEVGQVDAIVAEDIGKFPDLNLADSLQRIPGVAITRDAGEGRNISVRGLGPQFTRIRINGMEAMSTTGGTDSSGGANRDRSFDFNVFASELFNSITVRKTASAEVDEGSLGATVDLQVARPFDYEGFTAVASTQASYGDLSGDWNPRAAALISNSWNDGRFGALVSIAYTERDLVEEGHSTVRWDRGTSSGNFDPGSPYAPARDANAFHPRLPRYGVLEHSQERLGATTSLQWRPGERTLLTLDGLHARFDATRAENFLQAQSFSRAGNGKPQTIVIDGEVDSRNNLVYGEFDNVDLRSEARYDELSTRFNQLTLSANHEFNDRFRVDGLLGYSKSEFDNPIQTTITIDRANSDGYSWDYRGNSRLPAINYGFDVTDPASWSWLSEAPDSQGSEIRLRPQTADNSFRTGRLDFAFDVNYAWTLKSGVSLKRYTFQTTEQRRASEAAVPGLPAGTGLGGLTRVINLNDLNVPAGTPSAWLIPDLDGFVSLFDIYCNCGTFALSPDNARANNRRVSEENTSVYVQGDLNTQIGDRPLRGNVGVRWVETEQSSTGIGIVGGEPTNITVNRSYTDTLPSLNLALDVTDDVVLRFGAAKVMARPGLGSLSPGVNISVSGSARTVSGQNPLLEPFRATSYDLGLEWYFAPESLLSLAVFYKDIDSFVQTTRQTGTFDQNPFGLPVSLLPPGVSPQDTFEFTLPVNTPGGPLKGFEVSYQQPFFFLPGIWQKFGTQLNYTYVESKISYLTATGELAAREDLTGLSPTSYNATLYFEDDRFGARVSLAHRDTYLTNVPGRNGNDVEGTRGTTTVDASALFRLSDSVELTFEGLNLTNEFNDQWVDSIGDRVSVYHQTGRVYIAGIRVKF